MDACLDCTLGLGYGGDSHDTEADATEGCSITHGPREEGTHQAIQGHRGPPGAQVGRGGWESRAGLYWRFHGKRRQADAGLDSVDSEGSGLAVFPAVWSLPW